MPHYIMFKLTIYWVAHCDDLYFCGQRPPQLVVAEGNNIFEVTKTNIRGRRPQYFFVAGGHKTL